MGDYNPLVIYRLKNLYLYDILNSNGSVTAEHTRKNEVTL